MNLLDNFNLPPENNFNYNEYDDKFTLVYLFNIPFEIDNIFKAIHISESKKNEMISNCNKVVKTKFDLQRNNSIRLEITPDEIYNYNYCIIKNHNDNKDKFFFIDDFNRINPKIQELNLRLDLINTHIRVLEASGLLLQGHYYSENCVDVDNYLLDPQNNAKYLTGNEDITPIYKNSVIKNAILRNSKVVVFSSYYDFQDPFTDYSYNTIDTNSINNDITNKIYYSATDSNFNDFITYIKHNRQHYLKLIEDIYVIDEELTSVKKTFNVGGVPINLLKVNEDVINIGNILFFKNDFNFGQYSDFTKMYYYSKIKVEYQNQNYEVDVKSISKNQVGVKFNVAKNILSIIVNHNDNDFDIEAIELNDTYKKKIMNAHQFMDNVSVYSIAVSSKIQHEANDNYLNQIETNNVNTNYDNASIMLANKTSTDVSLNDLALNNTNTDINSSKTILDMNNNTSRKVARRNLEKLASDGHMNVVQENIKLQYNAIIANVQAATSIGSSIGNAISSGGVLVPSVIMNTAGTLINVATQESIDSAVTDLTNQMIRANYIETSELSADVNGIDKTITEDVYINVTTEQRDGLLPTNNKNVLDESNRANLEKVNRTHGVNAGNITDWKNDNSTVNSNIKSNSLNNIELKNKQYLRSAPIVLNNRVSQNSNVRDIINVNFTLLTPQNFEEIGEYFKVFGYKYSKNITINNFNLISSTFWKFGNIDFKNVNTTRKEYMELKEIFINGIHFVSDFTYA